MGETINVHVAVGGSTSIAVLPAGQYFIDIGLTTSLFHCSPDPNAYVERYNRTIRYAWLARTLFDTIDQVQDKATRWLWTYNHERPNMALGGITPAMKLAMAA
ncbi:hypothetical protein CIW71_24335 (plasmid) [Xanthomonas citri pv. malvacearum]|nr:hypothetical protein CIW71_24335 [Xanthomonas citri pv. malvacearum]